MPPLTFFISAALKAFLRGSDFARVRFFVAFAMTLLCSFVVLGLVALTLKSIQRALIAAGSAPLA